MFKCKECGKEFEDWHALGGHMRTHWGRREKREVVPSKKERERELLGRALERLSELSPQEAWQVVVNWIIDVHRQEQIRDDLIRSYRLGVQENETKIEAVQSKLKKLKDMVEARDLQGKMDI
jgi:hypothetical protein